MHTETRIGVSVGLRGRKCMQSGMHTKRIQNAYKHIKEKKRGFFLLLLLYIVCFYLLLSAISGISRQTVNNLPLLVFADNGLFRAFIARLTSRPPPSRPILNLRLPYAPAGVYAFRPSHRLHCPDGRSKTCMHCMHQKTDYACYARTQLRN